MWPISSYQPDITGRRAGKGSAVVSLVFPLNRCRDVNHTKNIESSNVIRK